MNESLHPVSKNGETLGPWSVELIAEKLATGGLAITDFVWSSGAWISLMEFADLKAHLQTKRPSAPPASSVHSVQTEVPTEAPKTVGSLKQEDALEWLVTRGPTKFGPFNYLGVIKAMQDKLLFSFDLISKIGTVGDDTVSRIADREEFSPERIRSLVSGMPPSAQASVFTKRQHNRYRLASEIWVNDTVSMSGGQLYEIGSGGAGLIVNNVKLMPGQVINIHVASTDGVSAFNAVGEIVSKKVDRSARGTKAPVQYGVRYMKIDSTAERNMKELFKTLATRGMTAS